MSSYSHSFPHEGTIAPDAVIHPGSRVLGADSVIGPGCEIGREAPATLINCQLGSGVKFGGGFAEGSVFLDGANVASGAHIRPGCLLEEGASVAHTVGLKQTILLPFVTCGSLINFCDCLMAGGTGPNDHSEVGSSFVHFNFTPHADKATPSLFGDVPFGVRLDQPPVFLGGQGGAVGPIRVAYGTVLAAGSVLRRDVLDPGCLVVPEAPKAREKPYLPTHYRDVRRRMHANLVYVGNLRALRSWYEQVRSQVLTPELQTGALRVIDLVIAERIKWLGRMEAKLTASRDHLAANGGSAAVLDEHDDWLEVWPQIESFLGASDFGGLPAPALSPSGPYLDWVRELNADARDDISAWLGSIVDEVTAFLPAP